MGNQQSQMTGEEEPGSPSKRLASLSPEIDHTQNPIFSSQFALPPGDRLKEHYSSNLALEKNLDRPTSPLSASQPRSQINEYEDNDGLPLHIPNFGSPEKISTMVSESKEKTKRRRSKKHSASKSGQGDSPIADTHSLLDPGMPTEITADQANGLAPGSPDNNNDGESGMAAEESESSQRRAKRERKEQKRALKAEKERLRLEHVKAEPEDDMQMNGVMHVRDLDELPEPTPTLKRKAKDSSSKKQRKKRKQQYENEFGTAPLDQEDNTQSNGTILDGNLPVTSTSVSQKGASFGHFAQNVYSSRYGSQHDTPNGHDDSRLTVDGEDAEQSPSAARLGRRSRSRANSVASQSSAGKAMPIQQEPITGDEQDDVEPGQYMDVDEQSDSRSEATDVGLATDERSQPQPLTNDESADEDMSDVGEHDLHMVNHDAQDGENRTDGAELGSEDLGAEAPTDVMFSDADTDVDLGARATKKKAAAPETQPSEPDTVDAQIVKESPVKSAKSSRKPGLLQQYGSKASTGRKRVAKKPFTIDSQEENIESLASPPGGLSPAAGAAKRRKARAVSDAEQDVAESGSIQASSPVEGEGKAKAKVSSAEKGKTIMAPNRAGSFVSKPRTVPDPSKENETKGPFSQYEMDKLNTVLEHWKEDHNMDQHDLNEMMHKNPQLVKSFEFWDAVHAVVPTRKRQKVIDQCRRIWHNFVALGTWTPEQHRELVVLYETHGKNYKVIGQMINRHPEDVRHRIRNYVIPGDNRKTEAWTKAEEDKLLAIIEAAVKEIRSQKAKGEIDQDMADDQHVDWLEVSEQMGRTRSRLQCIYKWKKLKLKMAGGVIDGRAGRSMEDIIADARREAATMPALHLYYVAKGIKDAGTTCESRIPWARLGGKSQRTGRYPRATLIVVWVRLRRTIPNEAIFTVHDIATKLCARHRHEEELRWPSDNEVDLEEEFHIVEKKILKILQATGRPKSAYYEGKSENRAVDEDSDGDEEAGHDVVAASKAQTDATPRHPSIELGFDRPKPTIPSDREIEESDYSSPKQPTSGKKAAKKARKESSRSNQVQMSNDDEPSANARKPLNAKKARTPSSQANKGPKQSSTTSPEATEVTEATEATEATDATETTEPTETTKPAEPAEPTTTKKARAAHTPSGRIRKGNQEPSTSTPDVTEPGTTAKAKKASTSSSNGRKTSGGSLSARRQNDRDKRAQTGGGEQELSSDTDAENVEDIPARVSPNKMSPKKI